jgi:ABC-2 type transport system permease protein
VKIENFTELFYTFYEAGRFPITVYRGWIRTILTFVVPVAFLTTFPAATLMGRLSSRYAIGSVAMAIALLFLSSRFWRYAIRFYSSASS